MLLAPLHLPVLAFNAGLAEYDFRDFVRIYAWCAAYAGVYALLRLGLPGRRWPHLLARWVIQNVLWAGVFLLARDTPDYVGLLILSVGVVGGVTLAAYLIGTRPLRQMGVVAESAGFALVLALAYTLRLAF